MYTDLAPTRAQVLAKNKKGKPIIHITGNISRNKFKKTSIYKSPFESFRLKIKFVFFGNQVCVFWKSSLRFLEIKFTFSGNQVCVSKNQVFVSKNQVYVSKNQDCV